MGQAREVDDPTAESAVTSIARQDAPPRREVVSETAAILSVIERAAQNPNVDIEKMERLFEMRERALNRAAREEFDAAFAEMQTDLPTIDQKGRITITDKDDAKKPAHERRVIQSTSFAKFEDINDAVKPVLARYGFGLSFRTGLAQDGKITVTGILSHRSGHREETMIVLPHDSTGSKNNVQAIGSSTSYGRRYTTLALLNISSRAPTEADDDGKAAAGPSLVSDAQVTQLRELGEAVNADIPKFCGFMKVNDLASIPASRFDEAMAHMNRKKGR